MISDDDDEENLIPYLISYPSIPCTVDSAYNIHGYKGRPVIVATKIGFATIGRKTCGSATYGWKSFG